MGVDTKLYISNRWTVKDVRDVITLRYGVPTKIEFHDWAPGYMCIMFKIPGGEYERILHCHTDADIGGFKALLLDFRSNEEGCKILRTLAETFGGLFQEADTDSIFEEFQPPAEGNVDFCVNEALKADPTLGASGPRMGAFLRDGKWKENMTKIHEVNKTGTPTKTSTDS